MNTIWKYKIPKFGEPFIVEMPADAVVMHAAMQMNDPVMWAEVYTDNNHSRRRFIVIGTGMELQYPGVYIDTFQQGGGALIWHLFEIPE